MAQQIFISYSRVDSENAEKLIRRLKRTFPDFTIWYDSHLSSHGGQKWWDAILDAIEESAIFLYLLSNESLASPYCQAEFAEAQRLARPFIAVQLRDRTQIPDTLADYQYIDLANRRGEDDPYDDLVASIYHLLPEGAKAIHKRFPKKNRTPKPGTPEANEVSNRADVVTPPLIIPSVVQHERGGVAPQYIIAAIGAIAVIAAAVISIIPAILTNTGMESTNIAKDSTIGYFETQEARYTETATASTNTPTPNSATAEAQLRQDIQSTATADVWTDTPTPVPASIVQSNTDWTPVAREINGVQMVLVPQGCFLMGSTNEQLNYVVSLGAERDWFTNEQPISALCFRTSFLIDRYEVSNAQFVQFSGVAAQSSVWTEANLPRESITWLEAHNFCERRGARLPTEAEWEYAARGPDNLIFPWSNEFDGTRVNFCDRNCTFEWSDNSSNDGYAYTAPIDMFANGVSWVGAYQMSGNVWEWVSTVYDEEKYPRPYVAEDGRENSNTEDVVHLLRGGSWYRPRYSVRTTNLGWGVPSNPLYYAPWIGFRCARSL